MKEKSPTNVVELRLFANLRASVCQGNYPWRQAQNLESFSRRIVWRLWEVAKNRQNRCSLARGEIFPRIHACSLWYFHGSMVSLFICTRRKIGKSENARRSRPIRYWPRRFSCQRWEKLVLFLRPWNRLWNHGRIRLHTGTYRETQRESERGSEGHIPGISCYSERKW